MTNLRASRRLALTDAGQSLFTRASAPLAKAEAVEREAMAQSAGPRGLVQLAAPMSFGILYVAPLLPDFFRACPEVSVDLHLSNMNIDLIGGGFDAAIRIAALPDSALLARRLCGMPLHLVAAPTYLAAHGRPRHPLQLSEHVGLGYSSQSAQEVWRFRGRNGETATVRPAGPLRVNNGEAMLPSLIAGVGIACCRNSSCARPRRRRNSKSCCRNGRCRQRRALADPAGHPETQTRGSSRRLLCRAACAPGLTQPGATELSRRSGSRHGNFNRIVPKKDCPPRRRDKAAIKEGFWCPEKPQRKDRKKIAFRQHSPFGQFGRRIFAQWLMAAKQILIVKP